MNGDQRPPARVLQFGTGRLLRGLCSDVFAHANADPSIPWEGSVVAVQSTGTQRADAINRRGGLFTLRARGMQRGRQIDESREIDEPASAFAADRDWARVIDVARAPSLDLIISNTTEAGLRVPEAPDPPDGESAPPSFVGKLLAVLAARAHAHPDRPLTIIPCELIESNGAVLRDAVLAHAARCGVDDEAVTWIAEHARFADSLVDRICTAPGVDDDPLDAVVEPYALWAIRDPDGAVGPLAFGAGGAEHSSHADTRARASVHTDITPFYARKVRVLNGGHIAVVHLGLLAGLQTVGDVMIPGPTRRFLDALIESEILPALEHDGIGGGREFAADVVDRFSNPHLAHALAEIEKGSAQKVGIRLAPTAIAHHDRTRKHPPLVTLALGAWSERTRRHLLDAPSSRIVLGTEISASLAQAAGDPGRFAHALFGTVGAAFGESVPGDAVASAAERIASAGTGAAIDWALG